MKDKNNIDLGTFTWELKIGDILKAGHGILEINSERQKQIDKHGFTAKFQAEHPEFYDDGQLISAAYELLKIDFDGYPLQDRKYAVEYPKKWDVKWFTKIIMKDKKDRIRIAAALLAAELDRLNYLENNK